jgi:hypothetical protein
MPEDRFPGLLELGELLLGLFTLLVVEKQFLEP